MPNSGRVEDTLGTETAVVTPNWTGPDRTAIGLPPRIKETVPVMSHATFEEEGGWLGTIGFLCALIVFGMIAGYMLRGGNAQGSDNSAFLPSALTALAPADQALIKEGSSANTLAAFGSDAPDELLALDIMRDGAGMAGLVRLHNTRVGASDRVSFVRITSTGAVTETEIANGANLQDADFAEMRGGEYIATMRQIEMISVQRLDQKGAIDWRREFPIARDHEARIAVATVPTGSFTLGPGERADRVGLVRLGAEGDLLWQRSFAADAARPDIEIASSANGSAFIALRNNTERVNSASHTLMRVEDDGQVVWKVDMDLGDMNYIEGFEMSETGQLVVLASGAVPSLSMFDQSGTREWVSLVPNISRQDQVHLTSGPDGDIIVATPYSLMGQRLYVSMQRWNAYGVLVSDSEIALPPQSSLEVLASSGDGQFTLAGSILPHRYEDTDILISQAVLYPEDWQPHLSAPEPMILSVQTQTGEAMTIEASSAPTETMAPQIASDLPAAPPEAVEALAAEAVIEEGAVETAVSTQDLNALSSSTLAAINPLGQADRPRMIELPESLPEAIDEALSGTVAISGFVEPEAIGQAQCRFTCLEQRGASTFPMWASVEAPMSAFATGLSDIHSQVCTAARGRIYPDQSPNCQMVN